MQNYYSDVLGVVSKISTKYKIIGQNKTDLDGKILFFEDFDFDVSINGKLAKYMIQNPCMIVLDNLNLSEISHLLEKSNPQTIVINCNVGVFGAKNKICIENNDLPIALQSDFKTMEIIDFEHLKQVLGAQTNTKKYYIRIGGLEMTNMFEDNRKYANLSTKSIIRENADNSSNTVRICDTTVRNHLLEFRTQVGLDDKIGVIYDYNMMIDATTREILSNSNEVIFWIDNINTDFIKKHFLTKISSHIDTSRLKITIKTPKYNDINLLDLEMGDKFLQRH